MASGDGDAGRRLDERLREARERLDRLEGRVERREEEPAGVPQRTEAPPPPPERREESGDDVVSQQRAPAPASGHVLFLPSTGGYLLVERDGTPPRPGVTLVEDGASYVVTKVGASPLPGDARPCAYTVEA